MEIIRIIVENAEELVTQGFKFYTYLIVDYHGYAKVELTIR